MAVSVVTTGKTVMHKILLLAVRFFALIHEVTLQEKGLMSSIEVERGTFIYRINSTLSLWCMNSVQ